MTNRGKTRFTSPGYSEYMIDMRRGLIANHSGVVIVGRNASTDTAYQTVWEEPGNAIRLEAATAMTLSSTSANDTAAGTNARQVLIEYLDENFDLKFGLAIPTGTTGTTIFEFNLETSTVIGVANIIRINRLLVSDTGTFQGRNDGIIYVGTGTITAGKPAVVHALILAQESFSHLGFYTVPNGHTGYIMNFVFATEANKVVSNQLMTSRFPHTVLVDNGSIDGIIEPTNFPVFTATSYAGKSDLEFRSKVAAGAGITNIAIELLLIKDAAP